MSTFKKFMKILRLSSSLPKDTLLAKCKELGTVAVSPSLVHSEEEIRLAAFLAERTLAQGTNIAKSMELEFLLWLSGETDLRKAFAKNDFRSEDFILVQSGKAGRRGILEALSAVEKPLALRKRATGLELERISTSRT